MKIYKIDCDNKYWEDFTNCLDYEGNPRQAYQLNSGYEYTAWVMLIASRWVEKKLVTEERNANEIDIQRAIEITRGWCRTHRDLKHSVWFKVDDNHNIVEIQAEKFLFATNIPVTRVQDATREPTDNKRYFYNLSFKREVDAKNKDNTAASLNRMVEVGANREKTSVINDFLLQLKDLDVGRNQYDYCIHKIIRNIITSKKHTKSANVSDTLAANAIMVNISLSNDSDAFHATTTPDHNASTLDQHIMSLLHPAVEEISREYLPHDFEGAVTEMCKRVGQMLVAECDKSKFMPLLQMLPSGLDLGEHIFNTYLSQLAEHYYLVDNAEDKITAAMICMSITDLPIRTKTMQMMIGCQSKDLLLAESYYLAATYIPNEEPTQQRDLLEYALYYSNKITTHPENSSSPQITENAVFYENVCKKRLKNLSISTTPYSNEAVQHQTPRTFSAIEELSCKAEAGIYPDGHNKKDDQDPDSDTNARASIINHSTINISSNYHGTQESNSSQKASSSNHKQNSGSVHQARMFENQLITDRLAQNPNAADLYLKRLDALPTEELVDLLRAGRLTPLIGRYGSQTSNEQLLKLFKRAVTQGELNSEQLLTSFGCRTNSGEQQTYFQWLTSNPLSYRARNKLNTELLELVQLVIAKPEESVNQGWLLLKGCQVPLNQRSAEGYGLIYQALLQKSRSLPSSSSTVTELQNRLALDCQCYYQQTRKDFTRESSELHGQNLYQLMRLLPKEKQEELLYGFKAHKPKRKCYRAVLHTLLERHSEDQRLGLLEVNFTDKHNRGWHAYPTYRKIKRYEKEKVKAVPRLEQFNQRLDAEKERLAQCQQYFSQIKPKERHYRPDQIKVIHQIVEIIKKPCAEIPRLLVDSSFEQAILREFGCKTNQELMVYCQLTAMPGQFNLPLNHRTLIC